MAPAAVEALLPVDVLSFGKDLSAIGVLEFDPLREQFIVQSPYIEQQHLLDLETLDNENAILAKALRNLRAIREDYAIIPYTEAFNWHKVLDEVKRLAAESGRKFKEATFYIVAFRSQIKPETDYDHLGEMDRLAHAEAIASGGFLR